MEKEGAGRGEGKGERKIDDKSISEDRANNLSLSIRNLNLILSLITNIQHQECDNLLHGRLHLIHTPHLRTTQNPISRAYYSHGNIIHLGHYLLHKSYTDKSAIFVITLRLSHQVVFGI